MSNATADIFRQVAQRNLEDPNRHGHVVAIGEGLEVIFTGDLHGNRAALNKVIAYADLAAHPNRRLILQEIIHGADDERSGHDRSIEVLMRAVCLKRDFPEQVIFLMGNHDLAQVTGNEISKEGRGSCKAFTEGVKYSFGEQADEVLAAVNEFCLSMTLAAKTANGVWMGHTLPSPERMVLAGMDILDRALTEEDLRRGMPVYEWTWGRNQTDEQTDTLAEQLGVELFLLGHKHLTDVGVEQITRRAIVLNSDHPTKGSLLEFSTDQPLDIAAALQKVKRIATL